MPIMLRAPEEGENAPTSAPARSGSGFYPPARRGWSGCRSAPHGTSNMLAKKWKIYGSGLRGCPALADGTEGSCFQNILNKSVNNL